jgi:hypothetical protein
MTAPTFTPPPEAPSRSDNADDFVNKSDAFLSWIVTHAAELAAAVTWMNGVSAQASTDAATAASAATASSASAGAVRWVSGTTYPQDAVVISPTTYLSYRRKTAGGGVTDPASDTTNWVPLVSGGDVTLTGAQQLTNKTLANPIFDGTPTEDIFTMTDSSSVDVNPANGSIQLLTLTANRTLTASSFAAGKIVMMQIADGTGAYSVNWSTISPTWVGGSAPTLPTSGYALVLLWKVGSTMYGAYMGNV